MTGTAHHTYTSGRWRAATVLVLVTTVTTGLVACRPPSCAQPFPAAAWLGFGVGPGDWPEGSTSRPGRTWVFDSDGDGVEDTVDGGTGAVVPAITVHRAGGDLVFTAPDGVVARPRQPASDFDGDGRSEIEISTATPAGDIAATYLVAGSTPDGTHHPADVGVLVPGQFPFEGRTGDVDGDGADDLVVGDFPALLISGRDLMAAGPGGTFDGPVLDLHHELVTTVSLTPEVDAIVLRDIGRGEIVLWLNGTSIRFTADNTPVPVHGDIDMMHAWLGDGSDGELWLVVQLGAPHPMVIEAEWAWNLRSLCAGSPPAELPMIGPSER